MTKTQPRQQVRTLLQGAAVVLALAGGVTTAHAQDAGALLREQQRQQELRRSEAKPRRDAPLPFALPDTPPEADAIEVRQLRFAGKLELLPEADRARIAAAVEGKRLGLEGIKALADRITLAVQRRGRLLGYALVAPQDVTEGVVTITLAEGRIAEVRIERRPGARIREGLIGAIVGTGVDAGGIAQRDLEGALLRANDLPGVSARARLAPGTEPGTSRLGIEVEQGPPVAFGLSGDNHGSASTGREQARGELSLIDLTGHGDLTRIAATRSKGQLFAQAGLSLPLGATGFGANASYGYLQYSNIDAIGRALDLEGNARFVSLGLDYTLRRTRTSDVRLTASFGWRALTDESIVGTLQDKRVRALSLGIGGNGRDAAGGGGLTIWSLGWSYGDLDLSRVASARAADAAGLRSEGNFHRVNASIGRLQDLGGGFSLYARLYGQWASKNLDSSEDFALGGPYGVRAWPVGEGRGDAGLLETGELRYDASLPATLGNLQLAAFIDAGHVWVNRDAGRVPVFNACGCNDFGLAGAGLAARWTRRNLGLSFSYAHAIGSNPGRGALSGANADDKSDRQQFWVEGSIRF